MSRIQTGLGHPIHRVLRAKCRNSSGIFDASGQDRVIAKVSLRVHMCASTAFWGRRGLTPATEPATGEMKQIAEVVHIRPLQRPLSYTFRSSVHTVDRMSSVAS